MYLEGQQQSLQAFQTVGYLRNGDRLPTQTIFKKKFKI